MSEDTTKVLLETGYYACLTFRIDEEADVRCPMFETQTLVEDYIIDGVNDLPWLQTPNLPTDPIAGTHLRSLVGSSISSWTHGHVSSSLASGTYVALRGVVGLSTLSDG